MNKCKLMTSELITDFLYSELSNFLEKKYKQPCIVNITIGNDFANKVYSRMKDRVITTRTSIKYVSVYFEKITYEELVNYIKELNLDDEVNGIMLQLPLPDYLKEYKEEILSAIDYRKDVDGLTKTSLDRLKNGEDTLVSCTALGIDTLLKCYDIDLVSKRIAIINRSNVVGMPLYYLMERSGAKPVICHSKTSNLKEITKESDIVVVALNKAKYITKDYIKDNSVVVDVGVHKDDNDKIIGDVDLEDVYDKVSFITPSTKSVGPMTICMLAYNAAKCLYKEEVDTLLVNAIDKIKKEIINH